MDLQVLELVFRLILTPVGDLEAMYCSLLSQDSRRPHVLQLLWHHFCHERNSEVIAKFFSCCSKIGPDALRALRLLWPPLFQFDLYRSCTRIAHGPQAEARYALWCLVLLLFSFFCQNGFADECCSLWLDCEVTCCQSPFVCNCLSIFSVGCDKENVSAFRCLERGGFPASVGYTMHGRVKLWM